MKRVCILLSSVLVLFVSVLVLFVIDAAAAQERATVTVVGEASDEARPDVAWISLTIRDQKPTAAEAANDNARRANAVIAAVSSAGVEAKDIATLGLALDPVWSSGNSPHSVVAFEATNRLSVRVQPVDKAGPIIAEAVLAGAEYQGVGFDLSDRAAREDALRPKAVVSAARRAALYAEGAAMKLGPLQSIQAGTAEPVLRPMTKTFAVAGAPAPPPIEPGPITLSESVTATWSLVGQ
jgi:uncharacterized protein YggE